MLVQKLVKPPRVPKLYPKQAAAIDDAARFVCIDASTKSGKTAGCISWQYRRAIERRESKHIWVAPTYKVARDIGFKRLVKMLTKVDPKQTVWHAEKGSLEVHFVNSSLIRFKGGDDPDGIYGEDYHSAVIDEASRCKDGVWPAVRSTLTHTRGPARIIGNVKGRKNWAYKLGQMARQGTPNMAYHKLTAYDAVEGGVLDAEEVESAKLTLPEAVFKELYLAEPTDDGANPFDMRAIARCLANISNAPPICYGVDLAKSDDWTVVVGLDAAGRVCVLERWQSDWRSTKERLLRILGAVRSCVDSTGVGDPIVEDLQAKLPNVEGFKFTSQSKQQLMEGLRSAIGEANVSFPPGWLQEELESFEYEYKHGSGVRYSAPEGLHDDGVCALALAVRARQGAALTQFRYSIR